MLALSDDFRPVVPEDAGLIAEYLAKANYEESNHNVINLYLWQRYYPIWIYTHRDYILLLGIHKGVLFSYMPLCDESFVELALAKAEEIFKRYGVAFTLSCFTEAMSARVLQLYPSFVASVEPQAADYIYEAEKLRTLSGKKLQKRSNNYNSFVKMYEGRWHYETLNEDNLSDVKAFLKSWEPEMGSDYAYFEWLGSMDVLNLLGQLPYVGGVIRIDGQVRAFVIGSRGSSRMAQINIEKADPSIRGLYQAIEKTFLEHNFQDLELINREDDMGLESLRRAKRALMPCGMIEKYRIKAQ